MGKSTAQVDIDANSCEMQFTASGVNLRERNAHDVPKCDSGETSIPRDIEPGLTREVPTLSPNVMAV